MEKVYYDLNEKVWYVKELADMYSFKIVNLETNEETDHILSWRHNLDLLNQYEGAIRIYDVELDDDKYYFIFYENGKRCDVVPEDNQKLERLIRDKNLFFTGFTGTLNND